MPTITSEYIELNTYIRLKGFATTGGQAKILIRSENVTVNGTVETRNKCKLRNGDTVVVANTQFTVDLNEFSQDTE